MGLFIQGATKITQNNGRVDGGAVPDRQLDANSGNSVANDVVNAKFDEITKSALTGGEAIVLTDTDYHQFTAPSDGYLSVYSKHAGTQTRICLNTRGAVLVDAVDAYHFNSLYLRKNTSVYVTTTLANDGGYFFNSLS